MKPKLSIAMLAALTLAGAAAGADLPSHSHEAVPGAVAAAPAARFATDRALRDGMEDMRAAVVGRSGAIHAGSLAPRQYRDLAGILERDVAWIVANCKLAPDADAALHGILAEIATGMAAMRRQGTESPADGAMRVGRALNAYAERFDDPGFPQVRMHAHIGSRVAQAGS
jgi:hypothetical protein